MDETGLILLCIGANDVLAMFSGDVHRKKNQKERTAPKPWTLKVALRLPGVQFVVECSFSLFHAFFGMLQRRSNICTLALERLQNEDDMPSRFCWTRSKLRTWRRSNVRTRKKDVERASFAGTPTVVHARRNMESCSHKLISGEGKPSPVGGGTRFYRLLENADHGRWAEKVEKQ